MVPPASLEFNSEGFRQFRQIYKGHAGAAFFIVPVWLMAVVSGQATQCVRALDVCYFHGKVGIDWDIPHSIFIFPCKEALWQLLLCRFCSFPALKENRNIILTKIKTILTIELVLFYLANLQTQIRLVSSRKYNTLPRCLSYPFGKVIHLLSFMWPFFASAALSRSP